MKYSHFASRIETLEARIAPAAVLYFSKDNDASGLYQLDPATGAATHIGASGVTSSTVGLTETADPFVLLGSAFNGLLKINADGSGATKIGNTGMEGMAVDLATGTLYGTINGDFFTVDPVTGAKGATLAAPGADVEGLTYGGPGKLLGLVAGTGALVSYNIASNTWSAVGITGILLREPGLAFDPVAKILYAKGSQDRNLYKINPATAVATLVGDTGIALGGGLALIDNGLTIVNPKTAVYKDGNGDRVIVRISRDTLEASNFLLVPAPNGGAELWRLDLSAAGFAGTNVIFTARKTPTSGDGIVHVGFLNAGANDFGTVVIPGDLAKIVAGDSDAARPAVGVLVAGSMGVVDLSRNLGLDQISDFAGDVGRLIIRGDFDRKQVFVGGDIGQLVVSGSLIGGATPSSGEIFASGKIQSTIVGGSIFGGDGTGSGRVFANGNLGPVTVRGAMHGGDGPSSGGIVSNQSIVAVTIGKSLIGGVGDRSGQVFAFASIGAVQISGSVAGGGGVESGEIFANGRIEAVTVTESVLGGAGASSGAIFGNGSLGVVRIGGALRGDDGPDSGQVLTDGAADALVVGESIAGGDGARSGSVRVGGNLAFARVLGSLLGGNGEGSAYLISNISTAGTSGTVVIGGDVVGSSVDSALIWSATGSWRSVTLGGSLLGGTGAFSGGIVADQNLGRVVIGGSVLGDAAQDVFIRAGGSLTVAGGSGRNVALGGLTVLGSVAHAQVLVGYGANNLPINGGVQAGAITVGGNWSQSSVLVGHDAGTDGLIGTADDLRIGAGPANIVASIASITVGGAIGGTFGGTGHFGFVATRIGAFRAGGYVAPLTAAINAIEVGFFTGDVTVREIADV